MDSFIYKKDKFMKNFCQIILTPSVLITQATASMIEDIKKDLETEDPEEAKARELIKKNSKDVVICVS